MDASLSNRILAILDAEHLMALSTQRHDGYPQTTWVNFIHEGFTLFFATDASSQKAGNIRRDAKVSAAISCETHNFHQLKGLSLAGLAHRITAKSDAHVIALELFKRLPQSRRFVPESASSLAVFRVDPVAISLVDYSEGFGRSFQLEL